MSGLKKEILMNRLTLPEIWKKRCSDLPESGMGYRKVNCKVNFGGKTSTISGIVLNGEILETIEPISAENILDISIY